MGTGITKYVLKHPVTTVMALLCLIVFGITSVFSAKLEQMPDMETPMLIVRAGYSGAGPEDICELVTEPIEDAISTLEGVKTMSSTSSDGSAMVMLEYDYGTDMDEAGQGSCTGCCQIFIAFDPYMFGSKEEIQGMLNRRVKAADASHPEREGSHVTCPGERTVSTRARSMADGVNVDELVWEQVQAIAAGNLETEDIASR